MPEVEALLYDFGNVIVEIHFDRVMDRWAALSGMDAEVISKRFGFGDEYQHHERGNLDAPGYYASLRSSLGLELDDAGMEEGWNAVFGEVIAPTAEIVRRMAPVMPQYLFSNTNAAHYAYFARRYREALSPFRRLFASHEMGLRKPDSEAFEHVAREMRVDPRRILFFDDLPANVDGARAVGMQAVLVRSPADVAAALQPWLGGVTTRA